ncbi:hypothetical protein [Oleiharenicola sp. Vm1]|uniref:hypothetical protein n=1 Tax=Oleiharenicola sp. Vm1 TaxID=3398393 RepID=UPI0039F54768
MSDSLARLAVRLALAALLAPLAPSARAQAEATIAGQGAAGGGVPQSRPAPRDPNFLRDGQHFPGLSNQTALTELMPVYFPATVPALETELPAAPAVRDPIWNDLAGEANELFFAPLSSRLAKGGLDRRMRERVDLYRRKRTAALGELRQSLAAAETATPPPAPGDDALAELATTADALRRDLYRGGFLVADADWNQHRNWRLGDPGSKRTAQELLADELAVMRAAIFYQEGLSLPQRQLLREIVIELAAALGDTDSATASDFAPDETIFFLPHGSRLRLPADVPAALAAQIDAFTAQKRALKRELRDALFSLDRESDSKRERALRELAARQEPRFRELESAAEAIRRELASLASARPVAPRSPLPPELEQRLETYLRNKASLQRVARQQAQPDADKGGARKEPSAEAARAALAAFEAENRNRIAALAAEARALREEVARVAAHSPAGATKSVDALLADFAAAFKQQQLRALYQDYRTAVLQPGLTPAQRELLFNAAVAALDLTGLKDWQAVPE